MRLSALRSLFRAHDLDPNNRTPLFGIMREPEANRKELCCRGRWQTSDATSASRERECIGHCEEPTGPARSGRPDDRLREAIQSLVAQKIGLLRFARNDEGMGAYPRTLSQAATPPHPDPLPAPKSDVSDFGHLILPNSGTPEFGGERGARKRRMVPPTCVGRTKAPRT